MNQINNDVKYNIVSYLYYDEVYKLTKINKETNMLVQQELQNYKCKIKKIIKFLKYVKENRDDENNLLQLYSDDIITHRQLCMLYFWYYPKILVSSWSDTCKWKRILLSQYLNEDELTNINNRYDLYKIMCKLPKEVILTIGY
jgi:hypothetical protein